jgi:hypothetical protein
MIRTFITAYNFRRRINMSVDAPHGTDHEQAASTPPLTTPEPLSSQNNDPTISRRNLFRLGTGIAVLAAGLGGKLIFDAAQPKDSPVPSISADSTPGSTPSPEVSPTVPSKEEWLPKQGDYLSPENLARLKTPEEITKAFELHKGDFKTIEDFAQLDVYRWDRFFSAGIAEIAPYTDTSTVPPEAFANAMSERYTDPALRGMCTEEEVANPDSNRTSLRHSILLKFSASYGDPSYQPYTVAQEFLEVVSSSGSVEGGAFTVSYKYKLTDNFDRTGFPKYNPTLTPYNDTLIATARVVLEGNTWLIQKPLTIDKA